MGGRPVDQGIVVAQDPSPPPSSLEAIGDSTESSPKHGVMVGPRIASHRGKRSAAVASVVGIFTAIEERRHHQRSSAGQGLTWIRGTFRVPVGEMHAPVQTELFSLVQQPTRLVERLSPSDADNVQPRLTADAHDFGSEGIRVPLALGSSPDPERLSVD
jgi:hypothetical protein